MKETTPARTSHGGELNSPPVSLAMPPCFDRWCKKFDDLLRTKAQKREFRHYLGGLLGESERKNVSQMARDAVKFPLFLCPESSTIRPYSPIYSGLVAFIHHLQTTFIYLVCRPSCFSYKMV